MNAAVIELMRYLTRKGDAANALENQTTATESEINARTQAGIQEAKAKAGIEQQAENEKRQTTETLLKNNLLQYFQNQGMPPQDAAQAASKKFAELQVTGPMAGSDTNLATSALQRGKQAFYQGQQPFQPIAGAEDINATIDESRARGAEAQTRGAVAAGRFNTAPDLAKAQDLEGVEKSVLGRSLTSAMVDRSNALGKSQFDTTMAANRAATARDTSAADVTGRIDPADIAAAQKAGYGAQVAGAGAQTAESNLIQGMGGLKPAPLPIDTMSKPYSVLSSMLTNRVANPVTAAPTNALPKRRVLTLDDLK